MTKQTGLTLNRVKAWLSDGLWFIKAIFKKGLRRAIYQLRDYVYLNRSGRFDAQFYALQLGNSSFDNHKLLRDYVSTGYERGLDPCPEFSVDKYRTIYPDVNQSGIDPFTHYLRFGRDEYRVAPISSRASRKYATKMVDLQNKNDLNPSSVSSSIMGELESPTSYGPQIVTDILMVQGWCTAESGIEKVTIQIDNATTGEASLGSIHSGVKTSLSESPEARHCGFFYQSNVSSLPNGNHALKVTAEARDGETLEWRIELIKAPSLHYPQWLMRANILSRNKAAFPLPWDKPSVGVIVNYNTDEELKKTLTSLCDQSYNAAEIIIIHDGLRPMEFEKSAIVCNRNVSLQIKTKDLDWKTLLQQMKSQLVCILDNGDILRPWALDFFARAYRIHHADIIYADEDSYISDTYLNPRFKPAWSPYYFKHYPYIGMPWVAKTAWLAQLNDTKLYDGRNDHQNMIKLTRAANKVVHIPNILGSKPIAKTTDPKPEEVHQISRPKQNTGKVSVIIPSCLSNITLIERCFEGLLRLDGHIETEVIIVANNLKNPQVARKFFRQWPFKIIEKSGAFNWSALNNFGAQHATGDHILFLNDDIEPLNQDWLEQMIMTLHDAKATIVGPLLYYPNMTIQHLGINIVDTGGGARHMFRFSTGAEEHLHWIMDYPREVSAITGACFLIRKDHFFSLGLFDEAIPVVGNDVDFCLRAKALGHTTIVEPRARLIHHEKVSRVGISESDDIKFLWKRWRSVLKTPDPFTNPNLDKFRDDWAVNAKIGKLFPPRLT